MDGLDLRIRSFKNKIINIMNDEPLQVEIKRLVLGEILAETTKLADDEVRAQIAAYKQEQEKTNSEKSPE